MFHIEWMVDLNNQDRESLNQNIWEKVRGSDWILDRPERLIGTLKNTKDGTFVFTERNGFLVKMNGKLHQITNDQYESLVLDLHTLGKDYFGQPLEGGKMFMSSNILNSAK